jgi:hypothetical protein
VTNNTNLLDHGEADDHHDETRRERERERERSGGGGCYVLFFLMFLLCSRSWILDRNLIIYRNVHQEVIHIRHVTRCPNCNIPSTLFYNIINK